MSQFAPDKNETIVTIPFIVWFTIVVVEKPAIGIMFHVEQFRIAGGICFFMQPAVSATALRVLSGLNRIRYNNTLACHTK